MGGVVQGLCQWVGGDGCGASHFCARREAVDPAGTRREPIPGGSWAPSLAPNGPGRVYRLSPGRVCVAGRKGTAGFGKRGSAGRWPATPAAQARRAGLCPAASPSRPQKSPAGAGRDDETMPRRTGKRNAGAQGRAEHCSAALYLHPRSPNRRRPTVSRPGRMGLRDRWAPWMALTSPHGWVHGVSRNPIRPGLPTQTWPPLFACDRFKPPSPPSATDPARNRPVRAGNTWPRTRWRPPARPSRC